MDRILRIVSLTLLGLFTYAVIVFVFPLAAALLRFLTVVLNYLSNAL